MFLQVTEAIQDIHTTLHSNGKARGRPTEMEDDVPQMGTGELMSLVRRGAQALTHQEININEMLGWDWETMLSHCKDQASDLEVKQETQQSIKVSKEEEQQWLSSMEKVESYVFNGKKYFRNAASKENGTASEELVRKDRRIGKNVTVMVDGFAINKESMLCDDWVAVPTMAGKDPRLAEPKREKRRVVVNQDVSCNTVVLALAVVDTCDSIAKFAGREVRSSAVRAVHEPTITAA